MANVHFNIERGDRLPEFSVISGEEIAVALTEACAIRKRAVERNAPRDQGAFAGSIGTAVERQGELTRGDVFSTEDERKVAVIEDGLRPGHFPGLGEIRDWAGRKGIPVFLAARVIGRKGIAARHVFERSAVQTDAECDRVLLDELPGRIVTRL
jgi:hypothetical protein